MSAVDRIFDNLLVSAPNGGGLFALSAGTLVHVDGASSTGIDVRGNDLLRTLQPDAWVFYSATAQRLPTIPDIHDVLLIDDGFLAVGTEQNTILRFDTSGRETGRWTYPGEADSMHINCLARWRGRTVFSAFGDFSTHRAYKQGTLGCGFVRDIETGQTLIAGLSQPHSLTPMGEDLLLANSETLEIVLFDPEGRVKRRKCFGAYTRGVAVGNSAIYVGLSHSRNIEADAAGTATLLALDPKDWSVRATLPLPAREIYDIRIVPDAAAMGIILARVRAGSAQ